jgi:hypothetical protein
LANEDAVHWHGVLWTCGGCDSDMSIRDYLPMGGIETAPTGTGQIDLRPSVQMAPLTVEISSLIAAGESRGQALCPTAIDKQYGKISACSATTLKGCGR